MGLALTWALNISLWLPATVLLLADVEM